MTSKPLDDPDLEMVAQMASAYWKARYNFVCTSYHRDRVLEQPDAYRALVAEARKQLRVAELREVLSEFVKSVEYQGIQRTTHGYSAAKTLLAKTEPPQ
jgi:hypothetical protein